MERTARAPRQWSAAQATLADATPDGVSAAGAAKSGDTSGHHAGARAYLMWAQGSVGPETLRALAIAHAAAGLVVTAVGMLVWYLSASASPVPALLAGAGAAVAAGAAVVLELLHGGVRGALPVARALLPSLDLLAALGICWLLAPEEGPFLALLLVPVAMTALLLGWRLAASAAAASTLAASGFGALRTGALAEPSTWLPGALVLALAGTLIVAGLGAYSVHTGRLVNSLLARHRRAAHALDQSMSEQHSLLEGLDVLEDAHVRLEQERAALDHQALQLAHVVRCVTEGDLRGARALLRGVGSPETLGRPLRELTTGLERLMSQIETVAPLQLQAATQQRTAESLVETIAQQDQLLHATDRALREQCAVANQLVADLQLVTRGSGELPGQPVLDRQALFQILRRLEQVALGHASSTAMLGARLIQLRARHDELDGQLRRLAGRVARSPAATNTLWRGSESFALPTITPPQQGGNSSGLYWPLGRSAPSWPGATSTPGAASTGPASEA